MQDDLFTFLSNKEGHCKKGSIVAAVRGTKAQDVVEVLLKIPEEQRLKVKEVTMDLSEGGYCDAGFPECDHCPGLLPHHEALQ